MRTTTKVGPFARPLPRFLAGETMRVYARTVPWVWLATIAAVLLAWDLTTGGQLGDDPHLTCGNTGPNGSVVLCPTSQEVRP